MRGIIKKVCMVGDGAVGKTSLIRRYVYDDFRDKYLETIGAKVTKKVLETRKREGTPVHLTMMIHDIAGQVRFESVHRLYYQGASGALVVCDFTRESTMLSLRSWVEAMKEEAGEIPMVLVVNKADLVEQYDFGEDAIDKISRRLGMPYYLTSAKTGLNVEQAFEEIGRRVVE
ncbi:MAG: Rab family GTPase [Candidatus Thermoplasmatota archaeon]